MAQHDTWTGRTLGEMTNPTLKHAKRHYRSYTRKVLTDTAREIFDSGVWSIGPDGYPRLISGECGLRFVVSDYGHIFAEGRVV